MSHSLSSYAQFSALLQSGPSAPGKICAGLYYVRHLTFTHYISNTPCWVAACSTFARKSPVLDLSCTGVDEEGARMSTIIRAAP